MKTILLSLFLIFTVGTTVFAQSNPIQESAREKMLSEKNLRKDFISGKRWKVILFKKQDETVALKENDFAWFRPGGTYEGALMGLWDSGLWTYEKDEKTITLNLRTGGTKTWKIIESTATSFKLNSGEEELHFIPDLEIKTDVVVTGMKKEISRTWKVVEHSQNNLKLIPKAADFIRFHPDGNYEQCPNNNYKLGSWSLDEKGKTINITFSKSVIWNITRLESGVLHLTKKEGNEQIVLK